ncbi:MAG: hypothetical protein KZQ94_22575 [Candidatus Thiodiazotropha sp. (ex Troendleina suluensis)]|nr:hypothetical protein [Candidatus Thiodiazotropha sp. (ex Troendleina suluensis)]
MTEIGIQLGFELITPESYGLEIPGVLGMAPIRAEEMVAHNAETIWISDETNQVIVEGKNLLSEPAVDKLVLELWDSTTGELLHSNEGDMPAIVNVDADGGFLSEPFKYRMVPVGPKNFQVYMPDAEAIAFRQTSPNIVVAHPHEVLTG